LTAGKDPVLGLVVARHGAVPVEMIRRNVENRGDGETQLSGALELKARQLKHVELDRVIKEVQRRRAQVASDPDPSPGARGSSRRASP
jgi:hypothetical protein